MLIGVADELRQLEYSQRLAHRARNVLGGPTARPAARCSTPRSRGGAQALGAGPAGIAAGTAADLVSLDADHPTLAGKSGDAILDAWIFANGGKVDCVWARGRKLVEGGRHHRRDAIAAAFRAVMAELAEG